MQRCTDGSPAYSERRASAWQYWQSILYVCTWVLCGKLIGWTDGFAAAGWRLQDDTTRKIRTARSTTPSAPTPAFVIDRRTTSREAACIARKYLHAPPAVAEGVERERDARLVGGVAQPARQAGAERLEPRVGLAVLERAQGGEPGRHRERVTRQRARLVHAAERRHVVHHAAPPAVGAHGQSAADDLAQAREVGAHAVELLGAAVGDAEARDHLVEDQERPVLRGDLAQPGEEARGRRHHAHVA